jgi:hypothetical protein
MKKGEVCNTKDAVVEDRGDGEAMGFILASASAGLQRLIGQAHAQDGKAVLLAFAVQPGALRVFVAQVCAGAVALAAILAGFGGNLFGGIGPEAKAEAHVWFESHKKWV